MGPAAESVRAVESPVVVIFGFFFVFDISIGFISIDKHANDPPLLLCNYRRGRYGLNFRSCAFRSASFVRGGRFVCPIGFSDGVRSCVPETADLSLHATEILIDFFSDRVTRGVSQ